MSEGMSAAIRCNDGYFHATEDVAADDLAENPRFEGLSTPAGAAYAARMCEEEGLPPRDRSDYRFVESAIPTLVVNDGWDPVTPPPLARYIAPGFSNGRHSPATGRRAPCPSAASPTETRSAQSCSELP